MKPRRKADQESFGQRLARLREEAGCRQSELAAELGISRRMMNYYERGPEPALARLLPRISQALQLTTDQLLGAEPVTSRTRPADTRLVRRMRQLQALPPEDRRYIAKMIDALVDRHRLRSKQTA